MSAPLPHEPVEFKFEGWMKFIPVHDVDYAGPYADEASRFYRYLSEKPLDPEERIHVRLANGQTIIVRAKP